MTSAFGENDRSTTDLRVVAEEDVCDAYSYKVCRVGVERDGVDRFERFVVRHPGTVAIIAVDADGRIALVRPFRPAVGLLSWEVPAGRVDCGEGADLAGAAARELAEEVGVMAHTLEQVVAFRNSPGHSDQLTTVFRATDLVPTKRSTVGPEEYEMPVVWVRPTEAIQWISRYGPPDAKSLIALLHVGDE